MAEKLEVKDAHKVDDSSFPYIYEENAAVPLKTSSQGIVRVNVYRPKSTNEGTKLPVLVTYGPYGKDIHYKEYVHPRHPWISTS
jgi:arginine utilization protein RocB